MNVLVISNFAPYDKVGQAGEKTHNYYLKALACRPGIHVHLITVCASTDYEKLDYEKYGIDSTVLVEKQDRISVLKLKAVRAFRYIFHSKDPFANFISVKRKRFFLDSAEALRTDGYRPDCIILEFTHCILLAGEIKKIFPDVRIIGSSHDVNYEGARRLYEYETDPVKRIFRKKQYENLKFREIQALSLLDCIVPHNENDVSILKSNPLLKDQRFHRIVPYYDSFENIERNPDRKTISSYGSMARKENYLSIIHFIQHVFSSLTSEKQLVVIGGNPPEVLRKYASANIHFTGFLPLPEVKKYFAECECMVVPLILGSGIKVKILEAFSGAVPVITNDLGNEGIFAEDRKQVILCKNDAEFIEVLDERIVSDEELQKIGFRAKEYVQMNFNLEKSREAYIDLITGQEKH